MQEALDTVHLVEENLKENSKTKPLVPVQLIRHREIQLPSGTYIQFWRATKHDDIWACFAKIEPQGK